DQQSVKQTDREQGDGSPGIGRLDVDAAFVGAQQLNREPRSEQKAEKREESLLDQPLLCRGEGAVELRDGIACTVPVVEVRPQHAEHGPAAKKIERVNALLWPHGGENTGLRFLWPRVRGWR